MKLGLRVALILHLANKHLLYQGCRSLVVDYHFRGLTSFKEVGVTEHQYDCILLSGLRSHSFDFWLPHGQT
ncbi:hypothetical protein F5Y05DRAFT_380237 [Hypoxylon sp. FL0543]|nr:hypothetical protein F5Y05DRAFT_380237 [Hypoxylon sp. FL0543]